MEFLQIEKEDQIQSLASLAKEIWEEYFPALISQAQIEYMLDRFLSPAALSTAIGDNGYEYRIAAENGAALGFYGVKQEGGELFLSKLYLKKESRGQGYASRMFAEICRTYAARGVNRMRLTCNKHNAATLRVYRHWGFEIADSVVCDIGGGYVMDDYVLIKEI